MQWRDGNKQRLDQMETIVCEAIADAASELGLSSSTSDMLGLDPVPMDREFQAALARGAETVTPGRWRKMPSGALHDAASVAAHMPVAMLFVPSINGISHAFQEDTHEEDLITGLIILAHAAEEMAAG